MPPGTQAGVCAIAEEGFRNTDSAATDMPKNARLSNPVMQRPNIKNSKCSAGWDSSYGAAGVNQPRMVGLQGHAFSALHSGPREGAYIAPSYAGLTRLRGRSRFGEA